MYADPRHIRDNPIKVRVNDETDALLDALAAYKKTQKAVLVRELVMEGLARLADLTDEVRAA